MKIENKSSQPAFGNNRPKWLQLTIKAAIILLVVYFVLGISFAIAIYGFHQENKLPKIVYSFYSYPAAWVNFRPITVDELLKQVSFIKHFSQQTEQPLPDEKELTDQMLNQLIDTELLRQQANRYGIKVSNKEVDETFDQMAEQNNGVDEVKKILSEMYGMNEKDFKKLIKDQLMVEKIQKDLFTQVSAKHILIKDEGQANEVLDKLKNNEKSFEDLAKEFSEDTGSKDNGGDLGWFGRGMMVPQFEEVAFSIEPGETKEELVKTDFGFHIIRVEEKKGKIDQSFTEWFQEVKENSKIYIWYNQPIIKWFKNVAKEKPESQIEFEQVEDQPQELEEQQEE